MIRESVVPKLNIVDGAPARFCELNTDLVRVEPEGICVRIGRGTIGPDTGFAGVVVVDNRVTFAV